MFHQIFPQEISLLLKIKVHNLPQSKNFRNSQTFPRTMSACPRLFPCLHLSGLNLSQKHFGSILLFQGNDILKLNITCADMEKGADTRTLPAEIFENCGNFLIVEDYVPLLLEETYLLWKCLMKHFIFGIFIAYK